jgi:hypothetical protein
MKLDGDDQGWRSGPVSAVVCNFNGADYLPDCLNALLELEPPLDELIVVDDGSTDASVALVTERFPAVRVLALGTNRGPCAARNAGLAAARNRAVLLVDNDVVVEPDVVTKLGAALAARPDAVAAQPRSVVFEEPDRVHYDSAWFHYIGVMSLRNFFVPLAEAEGEGVVDVDGLVALTALVDREALGQVGGFDESLFYLMEDYELALRLRLRGHALLSVEDALVRHKGGTAGLSFREEREGVHYPERRAYFHSRNRLMILAKNYHWRTLLLCAPALAVYELVWLAFSALKGNFLATLSGKLGFLAQLPGVLVLRRDVQRTRARNDRDLFVGGPLTLTPQLVAKPVARSLARALDLFLRAWWAIVRPLCG